MGKETTMTDINKTETNPFLTEPTETETHFTDLYNREELINHILFTEDETAERNKQMQELLSTLDYIVDNSSASELRTDLHRALTECHITF